MYEIFVCHCIIFNCVLFIRAWAAIGPRVKFFGGRAKVWLLHVHWLAGHGLFTGGCGYQAFPQLFFFFFAFCLNLIGCLFLFIDF